ncbi:alpha/beta hydrolase [Paenibacillus mesophilus]|uniref:alpha/beta fold hydrolase n=1 Tax=Paenibacillus mesophilus TaxID=2582849 RepID=UPI00110F4961|nr:alpha/beta hydrolase [Paenibacillus mesophilus]TMV52286.1 alpha/beta hydrolase [Paenibacillus mesophilus]
MNQTQVVKRAEEQVGIVFIHGAGLYGKIWGSMTEGLENPSLAVDFPNGNAADVETPRKHLSMQDYITHMNDQIAAWKVRKFVIVAHSLGGTLALKVAAAFPDRLVGFAAIGAVIPQRGGSFLSTMPLPKRMILGALLRLAGTKPPESAIRQGLCSDLSPEQAAAVVSGFVPESIRVYTERVGALAPDVPKLYIKLGQDRELPLREQERMASNLGANDTELLDAGHLPMLSRPDELLQVLNAFMSRIGTGVPV